MQPREVGVLVGVEPPRVLDVPGRENHYVARVIGVEVERDYEIVVARELQVCDVAFAARDVA